MDGVAYEKDDRQACSQQSQKEQGQVSDRIVLVWSESNWFGFGLEEIVLK